MEKKYLERLAHLSFIKAILVTPAPRWMVLIADTLIVAFCCNATFLLNGQGLPFSDITFQAGVITLTYLIFSLILKSYQYIIRLSAIEDMYRLAMLVSLSSSTLIIGCLIFESIYGSRNMSIWNICIIAGVSFSLMMSMRLLMKYIYTLITGAAGNRKPVIVLGTSINSFVFASALKNETEGRFEPVAILNKSDKHYDSTLNGIPIIQFDANSTKSIFEKYHCDTLLFMSTQIDLMRSEFADLFLSNGIKLLMLNQFEEFEVAPTNDTLPTMLSRYVRDINIEDLLGRDTIHTNNPHIVQQIKDSVVLITGAAGSIGREIVFQIAALGAKEIVLVDQAETPMHDIHLELEERFPNAKTHLFIGDIKNLPRMEYVFKTFRPQFVFHAAAYKHVPMMENNPSEAILTNVIGTKNIADLSIKYEVDKFVMISTDKAVKPTNIMGASKRIAEIYVQSLHFHNAKALSQRHTRFITTRFGNVLGSNGSVIPRFQKQIEAGGPVTVTHKDIIRYFMTIPEACSLVLEAGCMGNGGEIYIFDMGKPIKIYDLACRMISLAGLKVNQDIKIVETGLRPGEKLYEELLNDKERTIATHHKKIMIAKVQTYEFDEVSKSVDLLKELAETDNNTQLVTLMKHIVPEYHSNNSQWENLDKQE